MPHANNLDLAVFPCMSKRHTTRLRATRGKTVATHDQIWDSADWVWRHLGGEEIARGYVLAMRLMKKVIAAKGRNGFLHDSMLSSGVRADFRSDGRGGIVRVDGRVFAAPRYDPSTGERGCV